MADIINPFPTNKQLELVRQQIHGLTRNNATERLPKIRCALCKNLGQFFLFGNSPYVGILCLNCGRDHPFRSLGLMWLYRDGEARP